MPIRAGEFAHKTHRAVAVGMITYKDQAGFRIIRVLPAEIGLHAVAHGLEHEPVRFPFHPGKTFGSQNRFLNGDLAHGLF